MCQILCLDRQTQLVSQVLSGLVSLINVHGYLQSALRLADLGSFVHDQVEWAGMAVFHKLSKHSAPVRAALADQTINYVTAALSVVAGLAWNDAVKAAITYFFPAQASNIAAQFLYAALMTVVVVVLTLVLRRIIGLVRPKDCIEDEK